MTYTALDKLNVQGRKVFDLREEAKAAMRAVDKAPVISECEALQRDADTAYDKWSAAADELAIDITEAATNLDMRTEELRMRLDGYSKDALREPAI